MSNQHQREPRAAGLCCPGDGKLRKSWLLDLEKEHEALRRASEELALKLKLLSHPDRVEILLMLEQREHCVDEMAKKLKAKKPAISYHLGLLKRCGMVCVKKRSRFTFYSLSHRGKRMIAAFRSV